MINFESPAKENYLHITVINAVFISYEGLNLIFQYATLIIFSGLMGRGNHISLCD